MAKDVTLTVRVPEATNDRLGKLVDDSNEDVDKTKKSVILREAIELGLQQLEARKLDATKEPPPGMKRGYAAIWSGSTTEESGWVASDSVDSLVKMVAKFGLPQPQSYNEVFIKVTNVKAEEVVGA